MKIGIIGTRGIPNHYGGFERFVELLVSHPGWKETPHTFRVYGESPSGKYNDWTDLREVGIRKSENPLRYYQKSATLACDECDVVLCCGVGISIFSFWVRFRGKILVLNPDGCEWRRTKWSPLGRIILRAMYAPALIAAQHIVIDAVALVDDFGPRFARKTRYIPYQAPSPAYTALTQETRESFKLQKPYVLVIARLEPENNITLIIDGFLRLKRDDLELLIVGPKTTPFFHSNLSQMDSAPVRFLGPIFDQDQLDQLRSNCVAYIHGHSVGGTNPSLLEALATVQGRLICHDNKYNREVARGEATYFSDAHTLASLLCPLALSSEPANGLKHRHPTQDERFHPDTIYASYRSLFDEIQTALPLARHA